MVSLCLCMIVKNEAHIIKRCLDTVVSHIDEWLICDTGSTDETPQIITSYFQEKQIKGKLFNDKWRNFGYNRSLYMKYAQKFSNCSHILVIDADDIVDINGALKKEIEAFKNTAWMVEFAGKITYWQEHIFTNDQPWKYVGCTHEFVNSNESFVRKRLQSLKIQHKADGGNRTQKYKRDVALLKKSLGKDSNNPREWYYLGQSYECMRDYKNAIEAYTRRITFTKSFQEEYYYALYKIGLCKEHLKKPFEDEILFDYLRAFHYRPQRLEALYKVVEFFRKAKKFQLGASYAKMGLSTMNWTSDIYFVNADIHKWKFFDEASLCLYYANDKDLSLNLLRKAIENCTCTSHLERLKKNLTFYQG